ncbi:MAG: hypothetical protein WCV68_04145 [Candidatus Paceibacterota bacterium]|jgi:hypothetical protein
MDKTIDEDLKAEIIEDLGLKDLTSIEQDSIISDLEEKIIEQVNSIILDRLDDGEKEELETLIEDEEVSDFLKKTIPDLEEVKKQAAVWVVDKWREGFARQN